MLTIVEYLCPFFYSTNEGGDDSAENGGAFGYLYE